MSDVFIPFNYQPESTTVKTGSDTVPAGKYWHVKNYSDDLVINGTEINPSYLQEELTPYVDTGVTPTYTYNYDIDHTGLMTFAAVYAETGSISANPKVTFSIVSDTGAVKEIVFATANGLNQTSIEGDYYNIFVSKGEQIRIFIEWNGTGGAGGLQRGRVKIKTQIKNSLNDIWLPAGATVDGTQYVVTQYQGLT
jgi:hypothetical protein